jgi:membrane protein implicated in regulation of membrane protease activity
MPWWGWIVVGAALLASEIVVDAQFYLIFLGISALVVGIGLMTGVPAPVWVQWAAFGILSAFTFVTFRGKLYGAIRGSAPGIEDGLIGEEGVALDSIAPGSTGRAELRGSVWRARNQGADVIASGTRVRVEGAHGVVLNVRAAA